MVLMTTLMSPLTRMPWRPPAQQSSSTATIITLFCRVSTQNLPLTASSLPEEVLESFSVSGCAMVVTLLVENIPGSTLLVIFWMESTLVIFSSPFLASAPSLSAELMGACCAVCGAAGYMGWVVELQTKVHMKVRNHGEGPY